MSAALTIGRRDRRTLGVGALAVGAIVAVGRGIPAWSHWEGDHRSGAAAALRRVALVEARQRTLGALADSARSRGARLDSLHDALVGADSPAEAGARLASLVAEMADESGVQVVAATVQADTTYVAGVARVATRVSATCDVQGLADLLQRLEGGDVLLAVRELAVSQPDPAAPAGKPEMLHLELLVEGLTMRPAVRAAAARSYGATTAR